MKNDISKPKNGQAKQIASGVALASSYALEELSFQVERSEGSPKTKARGASRSIRKSEKLTVKEECGQYSSDESSEIDKEMQPGAFGVAGSQAENQLIAEDQPSVDEANIPDGDNKDRAMLVEADLAPEITAAEQVNIQEEEAIIVKKKQYKRVLWFAMLLYGFAVVWNIAAFVWFFVHPPQAFGRLIDPLLAGFFEAAFLISIATVVIFIPTTCSGSVKLEDYAPDDRQLLREAQVASVGSFLFSFVALPLVFCLPEQQWLAYTILTWIFAGTVFTLNRVHLLQCSHENRHKKPKIFWFGFVIFFLGLSGFTIWYCLNPIYPDCHVTCASCIGNSYCEGELYSTEACGYDGGDCVAFIQKYPGCNVRYPYWISDGTCHAGEYNTKECGYDGGDCVVENGDYPDCVVPNPSQIGDGSCDGRVYGTVECGFDGGDCLQPGERCRGHLECASEVCDPVTKVCNSPFVSELYPNCSVGMPNWIGDGECDGGNYASEACGFDGGDCLKLGEPCSKDEECASAFCNATTKVCYLGVLESYPDCDVEYPKKIGNGVCDGGNYGTEECGYDGGDCLKPAYQNSAESTRFPTFHVTATSVLLSFILVI